MPTKLNNERSRFDACVANGLTRLQQNAPDPLGEMQFAGLDPMIGAKTGLLASPSVTRERRSIATLKHVTYGIRSGVGRWILEGVYGRVGTSFFFFFAAIVYITLYYFSILYINVVCTMNDNFDVGRNV